MSEEERADLVARAEAAFGSLDILVNNAAMGRWAMPSALSLSDRRKMFEVNLHAPVDLAQQALPGMRARKRGWILNVGSDSSVQPPVPYRAAPEAIHAIVGYGTSKAALDRYSVGLAHEVAPDGVFVNVLSPVAIVLTQGAERYAGEIARSNPDMVEPLELMVEAAIELDPAVRAQLYSELQTLLFDDPMWLIAAQEGVVSARRDWVTGFVSNPLWPRPSLKFAFMDKG